VCVVLVCVGKLTDYSFQAVKQILAASIILEKQSILRATSSEKIMQPKIVDSASFFKTSVRCFLVIL